MPAPRDNKFAAKPPDEQHNETLYVRLKKHDKERIVEAAGDKGIAAWARGVLLSAAARQGGKTANQTVQRRSVKHLSVPRCGSSGAAAR